VRILHVVVDLAAELCGQINDDMKDAHT